MGLLKGLKKLGKAFNPVEWANDKVKGALKGSPGNGPQPGNQERYIREGYGAALASQSSALADLPETFAKAEKGIAKGESAALQDVQDYSTQATAASEADLASRGLGNTSLMDNARQGVAAETSRAAAQVRARYAGLRSELALTQGREQSRIKGNISQLNAGLGSALAGQANFQQQLEHDWQMNQNPDAFLDSLLGIAGTAAGVYIGKAI